MVSTTSVANPHANTRAELAVKTVKRLSRNCRGIGGKLETTKFSMALLQYRNTPDRDTNLSPAMALLGRQLRDFIPQSPQKLVGKMWQDIADAREQALLPRGKGAHEQWSAHARNLPPLKVGDDVMVQNQRGNYPRRWDKRGVVVEVLPHDQHQVRVEGSRKLTLRNQRYLRKYTRFQPQQFEVVPVDREMDKQANAHVPAQVTQGREVGDGRVEDPVPDRVIQEPVGGEGGVEDPVHDPAVQGPKGGDVVDNGELQPEAVMADPIPTIRRSARVTKVPAKYKDYVMDG